MQIISYFIYKNNFPVFKITEGELIMSKTVLITGATGDICQAIVRAFKGYNVVIQYNKNSALSE